MKSLEADLKKGIFHTSYLLYGPQSYLRKKYEEAIVSALLPEGDTMNLAKFFGKKTDLKEIFELAETMPFFAEKRVIILEETGLFLKPCEELSDYIPNIPDSCCIIFSEEKADSRLKQTKAVKSNGCVAEFTNLSEAELEKWILARLKKEHRQITKNALDLFMQRCSDDMWQIGNDLEKLISYTFGKEGILPEDVEKVCPALPEDKIFAMIDAIFAKDGKTALRLYSDLLKLRNDPLGIMGLVREQLRLMLHAKELESQRIPLRDMASILKMRDTRVKMALPAARKSSKINLMSGMKLCADRDEEIKNGLIDPVIGVETLILQLCSV